MNILFPPVDDQYIKSKVEDGFYTNATELVRDAVRRLREADDAKHDRLRAALEEGERAVPEGRYREFTPEVFEEIMENAAKHAAAGRKPNPDVCP
jgi:antitoxin ParD1/3/4